MSKNVQFLIINHLIRLIVLNVTLIVINVKIHQLRVYHVHQEDIWINLIIHVY